MIFKYEELRHFFDEINKRGRTQLFKDWKGDNVFLIRHDVDFDIQLAYDLALIEKEQGIVATYFILTTCYSYNVLSNENRALLRKMIDMGHEIGLHFDPTLYDGDLNDAVEKETNVLAFACGQKIKSISLHNPSVHGQYPMFEGYMNAYRPEVFTNDTYISDSCFDFRGKIPLDFIANIEKGPVQVLLHPLHYSETGEGYDVVFPNALKHRINIIHDEFSNNAAYKRQVGRSLLELLKKSI
jgi:hypothetical protein